MPRTKMRMVEFIAPLASILTIASCVFWYVATLDKRISMVEQDQIDMSTQIKTYRDDLNGYNTNVFNQLSRLDDKIQKIYTLLINSKTKEIV